MNKDLKICILGLGYISSRLLLDLKENYSNITTVDIGWYCNNQDVKIDYNNLDYSFFLSFDVVILTAAHSSSKMAETGDSSSFKNNCSNFINLLPKLKDNVTFIYCSSSSVFNGTIDREATENDPIGLKVAGKYDATKIISDTYIQTQKINYYGLRFGTVVGWSSSDHGIRGELMINSMHKSCVENGYLTVNNPEINRPILSIKDLSLAIQTIIKNPNYPGIYNLCTLNSTVGQIGEEVAHYMKAKVKTTISDNKSYNFRMSNEKFCKTFDFEFKHGIQSILFGLNQPNNVYSDRNTPIIY